MYTYDCDALEWSSHDCEFLGVVTREVPQPHDNTFFFAIKFGTVAASACPDGVIPHRKMVSDPFNDDQGKASSGFGARCGNHDSLGSLAVDAQGPLSLAAILRWMRLIFLSLPLTASAPGDGNHMLSSLTTGLKWSPNFPHAGVRLCVTSMSFSVCGLVSWSCETFVRWQLDDGGIF